MPRTKRSRPRFVPDGDMSLISLSLALIWLLLSGPRRALATADRRRRRTRRSATPDQSGPPQLSPEARLAKSIGHLRDRSPEMSASSTLTRRQQLVVVLLLGATAASFGAAPMLTLQVLV